MSANPFAVKIAPRDVLNAASSELVWLAVRRKAEIARGSKEIFEKIERDLETLIAELTLCDYHNSDATWMKTDEAVWVSLHTARYVFGCTSPRIDEALAAR